jgi:pimeloyl-ACP methyl ester carboxylesterase
MIEWQDAEDPGGSATLEFRITEEGTRDITGAIWLPETANPNSTLMCFGHGASGNRYQAPITHLANRFTREAGLPVLSIDGPVHGLRQVGEGGRTAFGPELRRPTCIEDMTRDWHRSIEVAQALQAIGRGKLAYFGLSMGSIFGIPLVASRTDVVVAALGLLGVQDNFPHGEEIMAATARIGCPLLFLMQLEDELFDREGYLRVFDGFSSNDKRIHANPGLHPQVPAAEMSFAFDFLTAHIRGEKPSASASAIAE